MEQGIRLDRSFTPAGLVGPIRCFHLGVPGEAGSDDHLAWVAGERSQLDCRDDATVSAATAHIAVHESDNILLTGPGVPGEERDPGHDHARRTIGALKSSRFEQRLLQRMQLP